jgi:hypothetical protein
MEQSRNIFQMRLCHSVCLTGHKSAVVNIRMDTKTSSITPFTQHVLLKSIFFTPFPQPHILLRTDCSQLLRSTNQQH